MEAGSQTVVDTRPVRSAHVQARKVGGDTLVVHLQLKQYHVLNHIAGRIWDLADGTRSSSEIASGIAAEYHDVDPAIVADDVGTTLKALTDLRLIDNNLAS